MTRLLPRMMFIIIGIIGITFFIYLAWQHMPTKCYTELNGTSSVVMININRCVGECWKRNDFGRGFQNDDCYIIHVFIRDKELTKEEISKRKYVNVYFDSLEPFREEIIKIRYNCTGKEISLVKME